MGPLLTLQRVRTSTQLARSRIEVELLSDLLLEKEIPRAVVEFPLRTAGPLSWKLTESERRSIEGAWSSSAPEAQRLALCYADIANCPPPDTAECPPAVPE
jgi:hypothetical protein